MIIERSIISDLAKWKDSADRKPLILMGARQVGKTWIMEEFGKRYFDNTIYINFDFEKDIKSIFVATKNPERILQSLAMFFNTKIEAKKTLLIFDEIQECNAALNSLKYFYENTPDLHIICAGSLLGVALSKGDSFPVGKVDFKYICPITFKEFLATRKPNLVEYVDSIDSLKEIPAAFFSLLKENFALYQACGGMPEVVSNFLETNDFELLEEKLWGILNSYQSDFAKHANADIKRIQYVWNSIPAQLAKENRKFIYQLVKTGARAREYEDAIYWLSKAGLIHQIFLVETPNLPLSAYKNLSSFKIYLCDIGLLRRMADLAPNIFVTEVSNYKEFKGAIAENYVLQSLVAQFGKEPYYWTYKTSAEIDFLMQVGLDAIPIEVKSGETVTGSSLKFYDAKYSPKYKLRYSMLNLNYDGTLLNIPLFLADWTKKFIGIL